VAFAVPHPTSATSWRPRAFHRVRVLVCCIAVVVSVPDVAAQPQRQAPSAERIRLRVDSLLESLHARGLFTGAVVLGRGDEELYARGFGMANRAAGVPFTPDTPADGASIAKTLTAAAVLILQDEGRLRLDDRVVAHVPEYPHADTRVRDLLSHSAGLPETEYDFFEGLVPAESVKTTLRFLEVLRARAVAPEYPRGTRFRYSSFGFDVAALVVERVSGKRWEAFLRERVFEPLGMRDTFLRPARLADWPGVRTLGYRRDGDTLAVHDVFDNEGFYGGSNLYFSARDLHRWSRSFYTRPVLTSRALALGTRAPLLFDRSTGIGGRSAIDWLGWYYHPRARRFHYPGSLQGFWASAYRDEDRRYSIIYVSNNSMPQWLRPMLTRALIDVMEGRAAGIGELPRYHDVRGADVARAAGRYRVPGVGRVALAARGGRLFVRVNDGLEYPSVRVGENLRYVPGLDVWFGFPERASPSRPAAPARAADDRFSRLAWLSIFAVAEGDRARIP
jgi:CubicO group peptidase (beta-lactamase class C family)